MLLSPVVGVRSPRAIALLLVALLLASIVGVAIPDRAAAADRSTIDVVATYEARAKLFWSARTIEVWSRAQVRNTSGHGIERLDMNLVPARIGNMRKLKVKVDGSAADVKVSGQTLRVPLGRTVADGDTVTIVTSYTATFRPGTTGHDFLFSSQNRIMSSMRWIPWVARKVKYQIQGHGDPFYTPVSPLVEVTLDSDVPVKFATSGKQTSKVGNKRTFIARNVRDFNFTAARDYKVTSGWSNDGKVRITVYTRTISASTIMTWAKRALARYSKKVGQYPYPTLVISESSGAYAMESPALVWLPARYQTSKIPFVLAHEIAHQWFYGVVGNDQTEDPFLDEAMAEFLTRDWFGFRASRCATKRLDLSMYEYTPGCYYEQIYVQGSRFVDSIRDDMGSAAFWSVVRTFWQDHKYQITTTKELLDSFLERAGDKLLPRYRKRFPSLYGSGCPCHG